MDVFLTTILCSFLLSFVFIFASHVFFRRRSVKSSSHLPPGRMGLPFLGESVEFILGMRKGRPESFVHERIRRYSSETFRTSVLGRPLTFMYGPAANKFLFGNEGKLVKLWWPKQIDELIPGGNEETFLVKDIAYSLLTPEGLHKRVQTMDRSAKLQLEAKWLGHQQVSVQPLAEKYTFSVACQLLMSIKDDETIQSLAVLMIPLRIGSVSLPINLPWTDFGKAKRASKLILVSLKRIIRERKSALQHLSSLDDDDHHNDMISRMLRFTNEHGEHMSEDEMAIRLMGIMFAGYYTSSATISLIFSFLADHEHIYHKVLQEQLEIAGSKEPGEFLNWEDTRKMTYSWNVVREAMRLYPPAPAIHRIASKDFTHDGYCISKGSKIHMNIVSTHRDPRFFPEPHKFDPSRFEGVGPLPYTYFPFGGGPRLCPGENYARTLILIFLHNIITRFKWEKVYANEAIIYSPFPALVHGLPIRLHPHP